MAAEQHTTISEVLNTNPKKLLEWDASVLQYEMNVQQWFDLVARQEYEVLSHVLQHQGEYLSLVCKVVAHGAVIHQDTVLMTTVAHLRPHIADMLATAKGPFCVEFLDAVQTFFIDRNPATTTAPILTEALQTRAQHKRLQEEIGHVDKIPLNRKM